MKKATLLLQDPFVDPQGSNKGLSTECFHGEKTLVTSKKRKTQFS